MPKPLQTSADVALYELIHRLLQEGSQGREAERRGDGRHEYNQVQLLAPYDGRSLPVQADFQQVQCHDISPRGFSFFLPKRPDYEHLIVALGAVPFTFFSAQIMHADETVRGTSAHFLVGCQFTDRIEAESV